MATAMNVHDREIDIYRNFFQELRKLREETGYSASEIPLDVPEAYYVNMDEVDDNGTVVVIEELKSQGFTMVDKVNGSDIDHVKLALTSLAHYHAHTIAFLRKHLSSDGQSVVFPPGFEYLGQPSAYEMFPAEMITPYLDGCIGTMKLLKREDVSTSLKNLIRSPNQLNILDWRMQNGWLSSMKDYLSTTRVKLQMWLVSVRWLAFCTVIIGAISNCFVWHQIFHFN